MAREKNRGLSIEELITEIKVTGENISASLFESLKQLIISGRIPANYKFPGENVFCEGLGVSRGSLREAYMKLETMGLVSRSRGGTIVNDPASISLMSNLAGNNLSAAEMASVFEYRVVLEAEMCALAAERGTKEELATLKILLDHMEDNRGNTAAISHYDMLFHLQISEMSKNKLIKESVGNLTEFLYRFIYKIFAELPEIMDDAPRYHSIIYDAIALKSPGLAREAMRLHLMRNAAHYEELTNKMADRQDTTTDD